MGKSWIGQVVQAYYPGDDRVRREAEALVDAGYNVEVICLKDIDEPSREIISGVHVRRLPLSRQRGSKARYVLEYAAFFIMVSFTMALHIHKYRAIHVNNLPDFLVFSALLPKLFGAKIVLDEHDPMSELFISKFGMSQESLIIRLLSWQEKVSIRFSTAIITVNEAMKRRIQRISGDKPLAVVMNYTESHLFKPSKSRLTKFKPDGRFTLVYAGTVTATYGLPMVIEAAGNLRKKIPGLHIRIIGGGDSLESLQELASTKQVTDIVELTGYLHYTKIPDLISDCDIGIATLKKDVLTDLCFNGKTVEYLAMGVPAVVVRTSSYEQTFPEGTVLFYEPGDQKSFEDAVLYLYEHTEVRVEMSRKGIEFSKTANWSTEKAKYVDFINRICMQDKG